MSRVRGSEHRIDVRAAAAQTTRIPRLQLLLTRAISRLADMQRFVPEWPALHASLASDVRYVQERLERVRAKQ